MNITKNGSTYLITHTDLDGVGCAILAYLAMQNIHVKYCNYDDVDDETEKVLDRMTAEDRLIITDISVSEMVAEKLDAWNTKNKKESVRLFDHHSTAQWMNRYSWCTVKEFNTDVPDLKTCGTELFYNWLVSINILKKHPSLSHFVTVVCDYDTWRWASMGKDGLLSKQINDLFYIYGLKDFINWCLLPLSNKKFPELTYADKLVLHMRKREINSYLKEKEKSYAESCAYINVDSYRFFGSFVFADKYISELGNYICKQHSELDFVCLINLSENKISFRTTKDYVNVARIASLFGGGGHPKSAGASIHSHLKDKIIEELLAAKTY